MSPTSLGRLLGRLVSLMRPERYTIAHTNTSIPGAIGGVAARLARVPLVIHTTHGFHFHENMSPLRRLPWVAAERWLSRFCDLLLCQNRQEVEEIRRLGIRPRQGVCHVGNGIDLGQFRPRARTPENERPVLLCVARLEPVKNHAMLFRAFGILRRRHDAVLKLVGEGPWRERYERELAAAGLADAVEFLGYRYDVPELTAASDVGVLTSVKEGIPRALMQAAAVGVPVVATDVKGTREVVVNAQTGFLVPLGDAEALAERLGRILDDAELRRQMGTRAAQYAREHFDEEQVVQRLLRVYRNALFPPDKRPRAVRTGGGAPSLSVGYVPLPHSPPRRCRIEDVATVFIAVACGVAFLTVADAHLGLFGGRFAGTKRATGTFENPNMFGDYLVVSFFICWAAAAAAGRRLFYLGLPLLGLGVLSTHSNGCLVSLI